MSITPDSRPELDRACAEVYLRVAGVDTSKPALVGRRGYYRDSMGKPGVNDINIYDDAIFLVSPTAFKSFNANTDPSKAKPGIATLKPGVYRFAIGIHNRSKDPKKHPRYRALLQNTAVTVTRQGGGEETGWIGCNIHRGGNSTTASAGCQTICPEQWDDFLELVEAEMKKHNVTSIVYALTERESK